MYPRSFTWEQLNALYGTPGWEGGMNARKCSDWGQRCLAGWLGAFTELGGAAWWDLLTPIDLTQLVGDDKKISQITCKSNFDWWFGSAGWIVSRIRLLADGTQIWDSDGIPAAKSPEWMETIYNPNKNNKVA